MTQLRKRENEYNNKIYTNYRFQKLDAEGFGFLVGQEVILSPVFEPKIKKDISYVDKATGQNKMFSTCSLTAVWENISDVDKKYLSEFNNITFDLSDRVIPCFEKIGQLVGQKIVLVFEKYTTKAGKSGIALEVYVLNADGTKTKVVGNKGSKTPSPSHSQPLPVITIPPEIKQMHEEITYTPEEKKIITEIKALANFAEWDTYLKASVENFIAGCKAYKLDLNEDRAKVVYSIYCGAKNGI
jgi:hypothetical protein